MEDKGKNGAAWKILISSFHCIALCLQHLSTATQYNVLGKGVNSTVGFLELLIVVQMDLPFALLFFPTVMLHSVAEACALQTLQHARTREGSPVVWCHHSNSGLKSVISRTARQ